MRVHSELGHGFLEPVYQEALELEFMASGVPYVREKELLITYREQLLKKRYVADFCCYDSIIVECKAVGGLVDEHVSQVLNYLHAAKVKLGLLINFGEAELKWKRIIC